MYQRNSGKLELSNPYVRSQEYVKKFFSTSSMFVCSVLKAVVMVCTVAAQIFSVNALNTNRMQIAEFIAKMTGQNTPGFSDVDMTLYVAGLLEKYSLQFGLNVLVASLICVLVTVPYFIIYFKSKKTSFSSSPLSGFNVLFVVSVIYFALSVLAVLSIVIGLILSIQQIMMLGVIMNHMPMVIPPYLIITSVIALILVAALLYVLYAFSSMKYLGAVKYSLKNVMLKASLSRLYGIMSVMFGLFTVLSSPILFMISSKIDLVGFNAVFIFSGASAFAEGLFMILFGIKAFKYRRFARQTNAFFAQQDAVDATKGYKTYESTEEAAQGSLIDDVDSKLEKAKNEFVFSAMNEADKESNNENNSSFSAGKRKAYGEESDAGLTPEQALSNNEKASKNSVNPFDEM